MAVVYRLDTEIPISVTTTATVTVNLFFFFHPSPTLNPKLGHFSPQSLNFVSIFSA